MPRKSTEAYRSVGMKRDKAIPAQHSVDACIPIHCVRIFLCFAWGNLPLLTQTCFNLFFNPRVDYSQPFQNSSPVLGTHQSNSKHLVSNCPQYGTVVRKGLAKLKHTTLPPRSDFCLRDMSHYQGTWYSSTLAKINRVETCAYETATTLLVCNMLRFCESLLIHPTAKHRGLFSIEVSATKILVWSRFLVSSQEYFSWLELPVPGTQSYRFRIQYVASMLRRESLLNHPAAKHRGLFSIQVSATKILVWFRLLVRDQDSSS